MSEANYFYKNTSIYFNEKIDIDDIEEFAVHECIHYIQEIKDKKNNLIRMGLCDHSDFKVYGLGLNEASVQLMASKVIGIKNDFVKYFGISFETNSPSYYPLECCLANQLAYLIGEDILFESTINSNDNFKNKFIESTSIKTFLCVQSALDSILYAEEDIIKLSNKMMESTKDRCDNIIRKIEELKNEIEQAVLNQGEELMQQTIPSYEPHRIIEDYLNEENHLAVISVDGGNFTSQFEKLPPITYSVELNPTKARETLEEKGVKVTTFTSQGKMPFKDEKLDVVVNELSNYDKFEMYRILKPGGYLVVDQLGSDNYKEIINMFIPFKLKGQWNKEACQLTLTEIGFDIVDSYEDVGHIRFHSLSAVLAFMKSISPERVEKQFMNFYADVLKKIKKNQFYEITTHKFMVIARKNDMKQEN